MIFKGMSSLPWRPHQILTGLKHARVNGLSVINDPRGWIHAHCGLKDYKDAADLYEIMTTDGEVHGGLTPKRALEMINAQG